VVSEWTAEDMYLLTVTVSMVVKSGNFGNFLVQNIVLLRKKFSTNESVYIVSKAV
jgi:hypothetical protein